MLVCPWVTDTCVRKLENINKYCQPWTNQPLGCLVMGVPILADYHWGLWIRFNPDKSLRMVKKLHHGMAWKLKGENDERCWGYNMGYWQKDPVSLVEISSWMKMDTFWNHQELADWPSCHSILTYAAHGRRHFLAPSGLWMLTFSWASERRLG